MWCFGFASRLTERNPKRVAEGIDASAPTPPDMLGPLDANGPKTDLPASPLTRRVPRGLQFTAPIENQRSCSALVPHFTWHDGLRSTGIEQCSSNSSVQWNWNVCQ